MPIVCEENIVLSRVKEREAGLPEDVQQRLAEYRKHRAFTDELLLIKRKRPKLERGDVFVVQPKEGLYFYGRVLNTGVSTRFRGYGGGYKLDDALVVCVYRCKTTRLTLDDFRPSYDRLLADPHLVIDNVFSSWYFYKLGNVPISAEEEAELDYGFHDINSRTIVDEYGEDMEHMPRFLRSMGLGSFGAVACDMRFEFIIDHSLLEFDAQPSGGPDAVASTDSPDDDDSDEAEIIAEELEVARRMYTLHINARLMPFDRGDWYEDPLYEALETTGLGSVTGAGTQLSEDNEPVSCDIEIELADATAQSRQSLLDLLEVFNFPKGSVLYGAKGWQKDLGTLEGMALYIAAGDIPDIPREGYELNHVAEGARRLLSEDEAGWLFSHQQGKDKTGLYLYGPSFDRMRKALTPLLDDYPLCQGALCVQVA